MTNDKMCEAASKMAEWLRFFEASVPLTTAQQAGITEALNEYYLACGEAVAASTVEK